jgi:transposase
MDVDQAAEIFECGRSTIFGWLKTHREQGPEALKVKKAPGPPSRLSERQLAQLRQVIIGKDPRQLQLDFALWTRDIVREFVKKEFGVEYTAQGMGKVLRKLGLSPQKPLVRAYEQDPKRVRQWKEVEYPKIHAEAIAAGATIFWCDEASVRTDYHSGTTWAPVGQTPIVRGTGVRLSANMASAISAQGKIHFSFLEGGTNSASFVEYLKKLLHDIPGVIYLIVDGHPAHVAKNTADFVKRTEGRLKLFFLPPYSPELNPDEWVWKNIKHDRVGRMAARTADELRKGIKNAVSRLKEVPDLILGFFRDPELGYIAHAS